MKTIRVMATTAAFLVFTLASLSPQGPARAQVQSKAQQKCLASLAKAGLKDATATLKEGNKCVAKGAAGKLATTTAACVADFNNKSRTKAREKLDDTVAKKCATSPDFGFIDAITITDAQENESEATFVDGFGTDVDAALAGASAVDPGGKCAKILHKGLRKLSDNMQKEWGRCVKSGLKEETITDAAGLAGCLAAITDDTKGKIGKAATKLGEQIAKKCSGPDLTTIFPGLDPVCTAYGEAMSGAGIGACSEQRMRCRVCRILRSAHDFSQDCDEFDNDGGVDGTCPACPNGVVDAGEQCDDGNTVDGDGCTADCTDEFCGDGIVNDNGAEECDDGAGNSDIDPDACRTDCQFSSCGDGVVDSGEECDDANTVEDDGCTSSCTICGDGILTGGEECDDGNTIDGDCCTNSCTIASNGTPCPATDECTKTAECNAGVCEPVTQVVSGDACRWAVVGETSVNTRVVTENQASVDGPWCGVFGDFALSSVFTGNGDIVLSGEDPNSPGEAATFGASVNVDAGDIVTNFKSVSGKSGVDLPGLLSVSTVAANTTLAKDPAPTFYDTTGTDPRVAECQDAQANLVSMATLLDALIATHSEGAAYSGISSSSTVDIPTAPGTIVAGGLNVIDVDEITGNNDITVNLYGGGDPETVVIVRAAGRINTNLRWTFVLNGGLTADNILFYSQDTGLLRCELGEDTIFHGTLFCPHTRTDVKLRSVVNGAVFGGGGGAEGRLFLGELRELNHVPYPGL